jgi:hypothetical protein
MAFINDDEVKLLYGVLCRIADRQRLFLLPVPLGFIMILLFIFFIQFGAFQDRIQTLYGGYTYLAI